jgi:glycosyltransferase involved in cell wall biosynthesis
MVYANYESWKLNPIKAEPYVSIVIPAYNEAERIVPTVGAIASHVSELGFEWELIVADDGSKDNTVQLLQDLNLANMRVLIAAKNGGKGSAVRRGMLAARGKYVLFTDADNSTPIENISTVLKKLEEGYDVAVGSRAADGASETNKSLLRHIMSGGLRFLVRYVLNIHVKDTQCGFKMFTREAAHKIHSAQTIDGFSFDLEELFLAAKLGYKVAEVPVEWMDAPGSKVDAKKEAIRFLKDMWRIRLQNFKGVYTERLKSRTSSSKLSVAVITTYPPSKGSLNEYAYHFIEALRQKDDIEHIYILTDELAAGERYPQIEGAGVGTSIIPTWRFGNWRNFWRIRRAVKVLKPDIVLFNIQFASFGGDRLTGALGLISPALVRWLGISYTIVLLHNIMETVDLKSAGFGSNAIVDWLTRKAGEVFTRLILKADLVALTIPKYVDILREKYQATNVFLAPHGAFNDIDEPSFSDNKKSKLRIMSFGKFGTYKRIESLIEAFALLRQRPHAQELELFIAGSDSPNAAGYLDSMKEKYKDIPEVNYSGYVAEDDVPHIFLDSDVVVFPYTSTTGSSGVLHQAGSFGRAVVLPHIGDFAELIQEEGYTGEFFEPNSTESLADAIERLLSNPEKRCEQGRQNYLAAKGVPIADVVDWYLMHANRE